MATIGNDAVTLRDLVAGLKSDQTVDTEVIELLAETNPILDDIPVIEANDGKTFLTTYETELPDAEFRVYYQGVPASKGKKKQVRATAAQLSSALEIDKTMYDSFKDSAAFLRDEIRGHLEAMGQKMAREIFYGKVTSDIRGFNGLGHFWNGLPGANDTDKVPKYYVFNGAKASSASTAALRSIWLVGWGRKSVTGFYPQGSNGGITKTPLLDTFSADGAGNPYQVLRQLFYWDFGLAVRDFRYTGRIANLEQDAWYGTSGQPDYVELIGRLVSRVKDGAGVNRVLYMSPDTWEACQVWFARKTMGNAIKLGDAQQRLAPSLFGIPVRVCDVLQNNEGVIA